MQRKLDQLELDKFDLLVVGGGIYGICVARDAVLRGFKVALIEANDFGSGTSHNSLKIIHGGIRYLQHLNFKRVHESVRERENWIRISNKLIKPLRFVLPTYGYGTRGPIALAAAVQMHNCVAAMQNKKRAYPRGFMISKSECLRLIPELDNTVNGAANWFDGQIIDADRLHIELLKDAYNEGLCIANYLKADEINIVAGRASGVTATDQLTNRSLEIQASVIVNATGPWAYQLLTKGFKNNKYLNQPLTKNFNVVVDHIGKDFAFGVKSKRASDAVVGSSKRMYFLTPWLNKTVIGTAHLQQDNLERLDMDIDNELPEFIDEVNEAYPALNLKKDDICYRYSGYTPAEQKSDNSSTIRSHQTSIIDHKNEDDIDNLVSVIGIKYTTSRSTAEKVVDLIAKKLNLQDLAKNNLSDSNKGIHRYHHRYLDIDNLNFKSFPSQDEITSTYLEHIADHTKHAIKHEMVLNIEDYILRRNNLTVRGLLDREDLIQITQNLAGYLGVQKIDADRQLQSILNKIC